MARTSFTATLIRRGDDAGLRASRTRDPRAEGSLVLELVREIGRDDGSARTAREFDLDLAQDWPSGWLGPVPTLGSRSLATDKGET